MSTMKIFDRIVKKELITKGWSGDQKYCVITTDGTKYLLRLSPRSQYETNKKLFSMMEQIAALGVPMCVPIEFGICEEGVYSVQSWIDGVDLEEVLPLTSNTLLSKSEQYALGLQAGKIAKQIHGIPVPQPHEEWSVRFNRRIDGIIKDYNTCGVTFDGDDHMIAYLENNRHLLNHRPQCFLVSDYNVINMMYEHGDLRIIDFERFELGDPWNEFDGIVWSAMASAQFATGQIDGYFDGEPPAEFFQLLAVYIASLVLSLSSTWAVTSEFGRDVTLKLSQEVLKWFDQMQNPVPTWYLGGNIDHGIKTERLEIKPYGVSDQAAMIELLTNQEIKKSYMIPDFQTEEEAINMFKKLYAFSYDDKHYERGIYLNQQLIGFVNDVEIEDSVIELGYVINPEYHNKGYATEMLQAVICELIRKGYSQIVTGAFDHNLPSIQVMLKCGMSKLEKEDDIDYHGESHHCHYYGIRIDKCS